MDRHEVGRVGEIVEGKGKLVQVRGMELGVFRVGGEYRAYRNVCPHAGAPICVGKVMGTTLPSDVYEYEYGRDQQILRCPWHGWEFDLKTGEHLVNPSCKLRGYAVEVEEDKLFVLA